MNERQRDATPNRQARRPRRKKSRVPLAVLLVLLLAGGIYGGHTLADYTGAFQSSREVTVSIPDGSSGREIAALLRESGVISHPTVFYAYARFSGQGGGFKAGEYTLRSDMSYSEIAGLLVKGTLREDVATVTFPEGLTLREIAAFVRRQSFWTIWTPPIWTAMTLWRSCRRMTGSAGWRDISSRIPTSSIWERMCPMWRPVFWTGLSRWWTTRSGSVPTSWG
mgnify:CR=1 FL=1